MKLIHRAIAQWIEDNKIKNKGKPIDEIIADARNSFSSNIAPALRLDNVRNDFRSVLEGEDYAYIEPVEVTVDEIKDDEYYRYEVYDTNNFCGDRRITYYSKGAFIKERYHSVDEVEVIFGPREVHFYVFGSFEAMKEDMKEENNLFYTQFLIIRPDMSLSTAYWVDDEFLKIEPNGEFSEVLEGDFS